MIPVAAILPVLDAALLLVEKVAPHIKEAFAKGEISKEDQAKLQARIDKIRATGGAFTRPGETTPTSAPDHT